MKDSKWNNGDQSDGPKESTKSRSQIKKNKNLQRLGGGGLSLEAFANAKTKSRECNPSLTKKKKEFHKNAKYLKKFKKQVKQPGEQTEFTAFRKEVVDQNMDFTEKETWYEFVSGHNSKCRGPDVGDYERELGPLKSSSSQSSYSQTSPASHRMSTSDASELERVMEENRIMREEMERMKETQRQRAALVDEMERMRETQRLHAAWIEEQATIMEQWRRLYGGAPPPPGPDGDGMGGSHGFGIP